MAAYRLAVKDQVLLIAYELSGPAESYQGFFQVLQQLGPSWSFGPNLRLVPSVLDSVEAWEALSPQLADGDRLLVTGLSGDWAAYGCDEQAIKWLRTHLTLPQSGAVLSGMPTKPARTSHRS